MTVAKRLETCLVTLMGLEQALRSKALHSAGEKQTGDFEKASGMISETVGELKDQLRQIINKEPQYASSEGAMAPWEGEIH